MNASKLRKRSALVAAIAAAIFGAGASAGGSGNAGGEEMAVAGAPRLGLRTVRDASGNEAQRSRFIVGLKQQPLAMAAGIPRREGQRIALESLVTQSYVAQLRDSQQAFLAQASVKVGRAIEPLLTFQHAYNGFVAELSDAEAVQLAAMEGVAHIEPDREMPLDTDRGPTMINAPAVWSGTGTLGNLASKGAGVVVAVLDGGLNIGSPSYAAMGADGYAHVNPLGPGNYLGWCNPSNPNHNPARDICNDKLIGGWDFSDALAVAPTVEGPGFEDEGGHGTHTSSTAVGNARQVTFNGITRDISGVAPHANLVIYDVCYQTASGGSCPNAATLAAINQTVADGIIDVLSYSISGGASPWTEANSQAFLAAQNAGIIVAASAGNNGPTPATVGHQEPWTTTVGGTMHDRVFGFSFSMTAPLPLPSNTQNVTVRPGGAPIATANLTGPLIVSPNFGNGSTDGCAAFPANVFRRPADSGGAQGIAVIRLDGATSACGSVTRRTNALAAGASGVIFVDVAPLSLGATGTSYSMLLRDWNNVAAHVATNPAAADARIDVPLVVGPGATDAIYYSSSRGPGNFAALKPDVAAPGVEILAAYTRWVAAAPAPFGGSANVALNPVVNAISGTSMAAPHVAGSSALLRSLNRSWTPAQVKSALMTTAKPDLFEVDGTTPATPFSVGAGRIDVAKASRAGLILDETGANYLAANPATGGNPSQLNIASFQNLGCVGTCTFPRTVKSTRTAPVTWTATINGTLPGVTVSPTSFTVANAATQAITLSANSTLFPAGQTLFGELVLTPNNATIPVARMPIALRAAPPEIDVTPPSLTAEVLPGSSVTRNLNVANIGNPTINWDVDNTGTAPLTVQTQLYDGIRGNASDFFTGANGGFYQVEDIVSADPATLRSIEVAGFMTGTGGSLQATATAITVKVYTDNAGAPAGNPDAGAAGEIYSCVRTPAGPNSAGLTFRSTDGANFGINLNDAASAGCPAPPALAANVRYWVTVYPTVPGTATSRRWILGRATTSNGLAPMSFTSTALGGTATWTALTPVAGPPPSIAALAMSFSTNVDCSAPWLSASPNSGALGLLESDPTTVTANAASLAVGNYRGFVCVDSNGADADEPKVAVPFSLNVVSQLDQIFKDGFDTSTP
ncbi:MAG: S8 family serine peptidase [Rhodanobacteraceae bacterium]|nr:S8 family serine peptidase [Rhodanobacteraceae bacterium]